MSIYNIDEIIKSVSRVPFIPPVPFGLGVKPEEYQQFVLKYLVRDIDGLSILHQLGVDLSDCILGDGISASLTYIFEFYLKKHDNYSDPRKQLYRNPCAIELIKKKILDKDFCWWILSSNPHPDAIKIIEQNLDKASAVSSVSTPAWFWANLCRNWNPDVIPIIEKNLDKFGKCEWGALSSNPNAIHIIEKNMDKINWGYLCKNPSDRALEILKKNPDKIVWIYFVKNPNPNAIPMIEKNLDKLERLGWHNLCGNPNAMHILEKNPDKIEFDSNILYNNHPKAVNLIEKNLDKVLWYCLADNDSFTEKYFYPPGNTVSSRERISIIFNMFKNYKPRKNG